MLVLVSAKAVCVTMGVAEHAGTETQFFVCLLATHFVPSLSTALVMFRN